MKRLLTALAVASLTALVPRAFAQNAPPVLDPIGNRTVAEQSLLTFTATASDATGSPLTFSLGPGAPTGASIDASTGVFTWTPTEVQGPGGYLITVRVMRTTDGASDEETIQVTVNEVNTAPILTPIGDKTVNLGSTLTFTATATDADLPANALTFSLDPGAPTGATITTAGAFSWTPSAGQLPALVTIRVTDNGTPSASDFETFQVTSGPPTPTLHPIGNKTVSEGGTLTFTATASDLDPGQTFTFSLVFGSPVATGATINATTGVFSWTPSEAQGPGVYPITVRVTRDSDGASDEETIQVTVNEVNLAPVLAAIGNKSACEGVLLQFTAVATDPDIPANTLTFSLTLGSPAATGATINASTGVFSWTPAEFQGPGVYPITICVTDNGNPPLQDCETFTINVPECDIAPVLNPIGNKTVNELSTLTFTATATDSDIPAQTLTFSMTLGTPAAIGATIQASTGAFSWTPTEAQGPGSYPITITVADNGTPSLSDSEGITITVNEVNMAPVLAAIGNKTVTELSTLTFTATATDADVPANTLSFSLTLGTPEATGATINATTGAFSWTPSETQGGATYPITVVVTDNGIPPLSDSETIQVTVQEICSPLILSPIGNRTIDEGSTLAFTAVATDPSIPPDPITYSLTLGSPAASGVTINATTGAFTWTPSEAQGPGVYPVTITACVGGSCPSCDSEAIQITVNEVNQPPVVASIGDKSVTEGTSLTFIVAATDPDIPANVLTCFLPPGAPQGASVHPTNCTFTFTPTECQGPGVYSITVCVVDNGSPPLTTCVTFTVTVLEVNQPVILGAIGNKTVVEGELLTFTAVAVDPDCPSSNLTFSLESGAPPGATISATGVFTWIPTEDQGPAVYTITIRVTDSGSPPLTDSETIQVTVLEDNSGPTADAGGPYPGVVGVTIQFNGSGSFDPDGDPLAFAWDFGDGSSGSTAMNPVHTYSVAGTYTVSLRVTDPEGLFDDDSTIASIDPFFSTEVFFAGGNKTTRLASGKASTCAQLEPVNSAYNNSDVDLGSIRMVYAGSSIPAISDKTAIDSDRDHDGIMEISACFSKEDLRILFADLPSGENLVPVTIEGTLVNGATFQGTATHRVIATGGALAAFVSPNPLNPEATATFQTSSDGMVRVQLFDLQGRLVRTLLEEQRAPGYHEVTIDGRDAAGHKLASGMYYLRIHSSVNGTETRAIAILK